MEYFDSYHYIEIGQEFLRSHLRVEYNLLRETSLGTVAAKKFKLLGADDSFIVMSTITAKTISLNEKLIAQTDEVCMTMLTFKSENPSACGIVKTDQANIMTEFHEKVFNPPGNIANGAVYLCDKKFFEVVSKVEANVFDLTREVIPKLTCKVNCFKTKEFFVDVGTHTLGSTNVCIFFK